MAKIKDIETAIEMFREGAHGHAVASEVNDYKTANKKYKVIINAASYIRASNNMGKLLSLIDDNSVGIRMWAATYLLPYRELEALNTLKAISDFGGPHSTSCEYTIKEWKNGTLKLV